MKARMPAGFGRPDMNSLMRQAQKMQDVYKRQVPRSLPRQSTACIPRTVTPAVSARSAEASTTAAFWTWWRWTRPPTTAVSYTHLIKAQEMDPELAVDGELQFDAAVAPEVAQVKCKGSKVAGQANTFIFPCIEAGNIGYKIAQRLGGYAAYGPILQGLNAPINDLSRGCNADEVYKMSLITACQS